MKTVNPLPEKLEAFLHEPDDGKPIVMINLLRYREQAAYPPDFKAEPCSGREAYGRYAEVALKMVAAVGGRPLWAGSVSGSVIAPDTEAWDDAALVQYPSRAAFARMIARPDYQEVVVHRTAALEDSRLIATTTQLDEL